MSVSDYSTTADNNTSISGINIAEGCLPSNVNNAIRQLMADIAAYREDVTADIAAAVSSAQTNFDKYFPSGCRMFFQQEAAPTGWKKITDYDNCALRLTSGTPGNKTTGKTFTECFTAGRGTSAVQINMGTYDTTLSVGQLAAHGHLYHSPGTMIGYGGGSPYNGASWGEYGNDYGWGTSNTGSNQGHAHGTWNDAHSHAVDLNVNYVDVVLCERT